MYAAIFFSVHMYVFPSVGFPAIILTINNLDTKLPLLTILIFIRLSTLMIGLAPTQGSVQQ